MHGKLSHSLGQENLFHMTKHCCRFFNGEKWFQITDLRFCQRGFKIVSKVTLEIVKVKVLKTIFPQKRVQDFQNTLPDLWWILNCNDNDAVWIFYFNKKRKSAKLWTFKILFLIRWKWLN